MLNAVVPASAAHFGRGMIMPNLTPPITTVEAALTYRQRILSASKDTGGDFTPLMTLYLTESMSVDAISLIAKKPEVAKFIKGVKLYPLGATTNSENGVRDIGKVMPVLECMQDTGFPLLIHGEVAEAEVDIFDREKRFIDRVLDPLRRRLPKLKITLEHITTKDAVDYVASCDAQLAATITVHHLFINRNHMLAGGIRPHYYCLPLAKRESHRQALVAAATSGDPRYFLGSDSAPHLDKDKMSACGCAGIYTAPVAMPCLAQAFEDAAALDKLEAFTSVHGAAWYGLQPNKTQLTLMRSDSPVDLPKSRSIGGKRLTVFDPMCDIYWRVAAPTMTMAAAAKKTSKKTVEESAPLFPWQA